MPGFLRRKQSLEDLEAEGERADAELSVAEKRMLLKELERREGKGAWKMFSKGGTIKSGMDWSALKFRVGDVSKLRGQY